MYGEGLLGICRRRFVIVVEEVDELFEPYADGRRQVAVADVANEDIVARRVDVGGEGGEGVAAHEGEGIGAGLFGDLDNDGVGRAAVGRGVLWRASI